MPIGSTEAIKSKRGHNALQHSTGMPYPLRRQLRLTLPSSLPGTLRSFQNGLRHEKRE